MPFVLFCIFLFLFLFFSLAKSLTNWAREKYCVNVFLSCSLTDASSSEPTVISTAVPTASPASTKQPSQQGRYFSVSLLRLILALSGFFLFVYLDLVLVHKLAPPPPPPAPPPQKKNHYLAVMTSH